jgi:hypothetical protein
MVLLAFLFILSGEQPVYAKTTSLQGPKGALLLALADSGDEAYDPFSDYSEFEEESEEEADINFFRNGRFFTMGLIAGSQAFTGNMGNIYKQSTTFGLYLSYFFDLRFALQFGFLTGDHKFSFKSKDPVGTTLNGNASFSVNSFDLKYYFNTQNVTRGLADLNPYTIFGFSNYYRTRTVGGIEGFTRDAAMGLDLGAGIEIPMLRNKMYFGIQGIYHYINFKDENQNLVIDIENVPTNFGTASGDIFEVLGILGVNF